MRALQDQCTQLSTKASASEVEKKTLQSENELLLLQLHQVQEELEHYYFLHRKTEKQHEELQKQFEVQSATLWRRVSKSAIKFRNTVFAFMTSPFRMIENKRTLKRLAQIIRTSGEFDEKWYLEQYTDVARAGCDPIEHYLVFGFAEGRNPGPRFDTRWYLESNPDVANAKVNPLLHYIQFGKSEGRRPLRNWA